MELLNMSLKLNIGSTDKEKYFGALRISASLSFVPIAHISVGISPWYQRIGSYPSSLLYSNIPPTSLSACCDKQRSVRCCFRSPSNFDETYPTKQ